MESPVQGGGTEGKGLLTGGASGIGWANMGASIAVMGPRKHVIDSAVDALHFQGVSLEISFVPSEDASANGFRTDIDIDAVDTFRVCHEALKYLKKGASGKKNSSAGGSVINTSATLHYTATWYQIHVSAAKVC
ncbi:hypothetical protein ACFX2J_004458 [Malus domestica]